MNRFPNYRFLPYWLVMPSIIVIVIFLIFPFAQAINLSFHRVSPFGQLRNVGWRNYVEMFASPEYLFSLRNTVIFSALVIGVGLAVSLCIALLTTQKIRRNRVLSDCVYLDVCYVPNYSRCHVVFDF